MYLIKLYLLEGKEKKKKGTVELKHEVRQLERDLQKRLRRAYWQYVGGLFNEGNDGEAGSKPCLKKLWTYMKHQRSCSVGIPSLKCQGRLITDPKLKAAAFNSQFKKVFSDGKEYTVEEFNRKCQMPDQRDDHPEMQSIALSVEGIEKLLAGLNPSKAAGPDGITPRVLRELPRGSPPS